MCSKEIPKFSNNGLGKYNDIVFPRYRSKNEIIVSLTYKSEAGFANIELSQLLETETSNLSSRLCRQNRFDKFYAGHQAVNLSTDLKRENIQKELKTQQYVLRQQQQRKIRLRADTLSQRIDMRAAIFVLIRMIKNYLPVSLQYR